MKLKTHLRLTAPGLGSGWDQAAAGKDKVRQFPAAFKEYT